MPIDKVTIRFLSYPIVVLSMISFGDEAHINKYTREDCIVKVDLNYNVTKSEYENSIRKLANGVSHARAIRRENMPIVRTPSNDRYSMYLQYRNNCEDKRQLASDLIDDFLIDAVDNQIEFHVTDKIISPSPNTIDFRGEAWMEK